MQQQPAIVMPTLIEKSKVTNEHYCDSCDSGRNACLDINATVAVSGIYAPVTISLCEICFLMLQTKFMKEEIPHE